MTWKLVGSAVAVLALLAFTSTLAPAEARHGGGGRGSGHSSGGHHGSGHHVFSRHGRSRVFVGAGYYGYGYYDDCWYSRRYGRWICPYY